MKYSTVRVQMESKSSPLSGHRIGDALEGTAAGFGSLVLHICIENPVGIMSTRYRKPDQIIQDWLPYLIKQKQKTPHLPTLF